MPFGPFLTNLAGSDSTYRVAIVAVLIRPTRRSQSETSPKQRHMPIAAGPISQFAFGSSQPKIENVQKMFCNCRETNARRLQWGKLNCTARVRVRVAAILPDPFPSRNQSAGLLVLSKAINLQKFSPDRHLLSYARYKCAPVSICLPNFGLGFWIWILGLGSRPARCILPLPFDNCHNAV